MVTSRLPDDPTQRFLTSLARIRDSGRPESAALAESIETLRRQAETPGLPAALRNDVRKTIDELESKIAELRSNEGRRTGGAPSDHSG